MSASSKAFRKSCVVLFSKQTPKPFHRLYSILEPPSHLSSIDRQVSVMHDASDTFAFILAKVKYHSRRCVKSLIHCCIVKKCASF